MTWARPRLFSTVALRLFCPVFHSPAFLCQEHPNISGKFLTPQGQELGGMGRRDAGLVGCHLSVSSDDPKLEAVARLGHL